VDALTEMNGVAVATRGGEVVVEHVGGTLDGTAPVALGTRFQIASASKSITAAAALLLVERGELGLTDTLAHRLDECPAAWREISIEQLLTHSSGLVHWDQLGDLDLTAPMDMDQLMARFAEEALLSEPGSAFSYSSPGYVLLGVIIESCSGEPYSRFLSDELLGPMGLADTFAGQGVGEGRLAAPMKGKVAVPSFNLDVTGLGAGDVWTTAGDLLEFDRAFFAGELLSPSTVSEAVAARVTVTDQPLDVVRIDGYGHGWYVGEVVGHTMYFHPGGNAGFLSLNAVLPEDDVRAVLLTNDEETDIVGCSMALLARAFGLA
jgi:CubicO group peptidase (beta-lactamase class C family)